MKENTLLLDKHVLICLDCSDLDSDLLQEVEFVKENFCGIVTDDVNYNFGDGDIYLFGNIAHLNYSEYKRPFLIKGFSYNYHHEDFTLIDVGQVPLNVHNVGIFFRNYFPSNNYFKLINDSHLFQSLRESVKPGNAYRSGIYLTKVTHDNDETRFNLLRCSTNLNGPTDNFRNVDVGIIDKMNDIAKRFFQDKVEFNHVLAQIYENVQNAINALSGISFVLSECSLIFAFLSLLL